MVQSEPASPYTFTYVPHPLIGDAPHVCADCLPSASTVLNLSHSDPNTTFDCYRRDTSTESVCAFWAAPEAGEKALKAAGLVASDAGPVSVPATNNHFDEDGLCALFLLLRPDEARTRGRLFSLIGQCGDFGRVPLRGAMPDTEAELAVKTVITIGLLSGRYRTAKATELGRAGIAPYPGKIVWGDGTKPRPDVVADLYRDLLARLAELIEDIAQGKWEDVWGPDWNAVASTLSLLDGTSRIAFTAHPALDFVSIDFADDITLPPSPNPIPPHPSVFPHNIALHSFLRPPYDLHRVLVRYSNIPVFYFRYESRVRTLRKVLRRPADGFGGIVQKLNELERAAGGSGVWTGEVMERITPRVFCAGADGEPGPSSLGFGELEKVISGWLEEIGGKDASL